MPIFEFKPFRKYEDLVKIFGLVVESVFVLPLENEVDTSRCYQ